MSEVKKLKKEEFSDDRKKAVQTGEAKPIVTGESITDKRKAVVAEMYSKLMDVCENDKNMAKKCACNLYNQFRPKK